MKNNYIAKRLEEFDSRKHNWRLDFDFWEKDIKDFLSESIHQALAEERERVSVNDKIYGIAVEVIGEKDKPKEIVVYISTEKNHKTIRYVPTVQLIPDSFGFRYEGRDLTDNKDI